MRKVLVAAVLVLALSVGAFAFQNEPEGFRGLLWGDPPGKDMKTVGFGRDFDIRTYERRDDKMQIGASRLKSIHYLFYEDRFMAVEIKPDFMGYDALKDVVIVKCGEGEGIW